MHEANYSSPLVRSRKAIAAAVEALRLQKEAKRLQEFRRKLFKSGMAAHRRERAEEARIAARTQLVNKFTEAASRRGGDQVADLEVLFETAFLLLTDEQVDEFSTDAWVQNLLTLPEYENI